MMSAYTGDMLQDTVFQIYSTTLATLALAITMRKLACKQIGIIYLYIPFIALWNKSVHYVVYMVKLKLTAHELQRETLTSDRLS